VARGDDRPNAGAEDGVEAVDGRNCVFQSGCAAQLRWNAEWTALPDFFLAGWTSLQGLFSAAPVRGHKNKHKLRLGVYSINLTNHGNFNDVYNIVTSPLFGQFTGFQRRTDGLIISFVD
jgi:hypothetical protein